MTGRIRRPLSKRWDAAERPRLGLGSAILCAALAATAAPARAEPTDEWMAAMRARVAAATAALPTTLDMWEAADWTPGYEQSPAWLTRGPDYLLPGQEMAAYRNAYEAAIAPARAVAARGFGDAIAALFAVATGLEPPAAKAACRDRVAPTVSPLGAAFFGAPNPADEARTLPALRASPALDRLQASTLVSLTCSINHRATFDRRVAMATEAAGTSAVFGADAEMGVPSHADGRVLAFDPEALVAAAAADGIQVAFVPGGGWFGRKASMTVTPFGRHEPAFLGRLAESKNPDGTATFLVDGLPSLPGLRTPEDTVVCLASTNDGARRANRDALFLGILGGIGGAGPGGVRDAVQDGQFTERCAAAKAAFVRQP